MEIILTTSPASELETGALVALAFSKAKNGDKNGESNWPILRPRHQSPASTQRLADGSPKSTPAASSLAKRLETVVLHRPAGLKAARLVLAGGGSKSKFGTCDARKLRRRRASQVEGEGRFRLCPLSGRRPRQLTLLSRLWPRASSSAILNPTLTRPIRKRPTRRSIAFACPCPKASAPLTEALRRGTIIAESTELHAYACD